jgi:hypothetical protein
MLGDLVPGDDLPGADADLVRPADAPGLGLAIDRGQQDLGGGEQVVAPAGLLSRQQRVAAGDQPLAEVARAGDLGQVLLIEQAELQRALAIGELAGRRGAQAGDPGKPPSSFGALIRAEVIIPRSPGKTSSRMANLPRTTSTAR